MRLALRLPSVAFLALAAFGCDPDVVVRTVVTLDDFLPALPVPDGMPQGAFAGHIGEGDEAELIAGPARSGLVGDFYMRNSRARFVLQAADRAIGIVPWGGNVVDAIPLDATGADGGEDHFGELSLIYVIGRTCAHESVEVLLDGSGGGPAVVRARGRAAPNDYVNLKGVGLLAIPLELEADIDDSVECATTYTLHPGSPTLEVAWTLWNGGDLDVLGPLGALADTGGAIEAFSPGKLGFNRAGVDTILSGGKQPAPYSVYQGPGVAYGVVPRHADAATPNAAFLIAGVSLLLYGAEQFFDILDPEKYFLHLAPADGATFRTDLVVGNDAADVESAFRGGVGLTPVYGNARFGANPADVAVRVGFFTDVDGDGAVGDDDLVVTYLDANGSGAFAGSVPAGRYLMRADLPGVVRSAVQAVVLEPEVAATLDVVLPEQTLIDFTVLDDATGEPIPARLVVLGHDPAAPDFRLHQVYDVREGIIATRHAVYGESAGSPSGDPRDPPLWVAAGGPYRVVATRGTEWSTDSVLVPPTAGEHLTLTFRLRRVVDTTGYIAGEFHVHALGSPDSPVPNDLRVQTMIAEGVEFVASTDHDYLRDFDPIVQDLGVEHLIDTVVGVEATPFAHGHFIMHPLEVDPLDPAGGAVDWATGPLPGFALLPGELFDAYRQKGARVVQINHPRSLSSLSNFQAYFDRAGLDFDFAARTFSGRADLQPVPAEWLRLSDAARVFDDSFEALEVWNGFATVDSDADGVREIASLDLVLRDWMNFLSFGKLATPFGNSDTHTVVRDAPGMPRTLIRVADDSEAALAAGVADEIYATILGEGRAVDVVVTNGPMLEVFAQGGATSAIGATITPSGAVTLTIKMTAAEHIDVDTIEIFANSTFDPVDGNKTALIPVACFTTRELATLAATDPCALAPAGGARPFTVETRSVGAGFRRHEATVTISLAADAIPARAGAEGDDAWIVVRARGQRPVYPLLLDGVTTGATLDAILGDDPVALEAALVGKGVPAAAFTAPIFVDFDGGGWRAPFAP